MPKALEEKLKREARENGLKGEHLKPIFMVRFEEQAGSLATKSSQHSYRVFVDTLLKKTSL